MAPILGRYGPFFLYSYEIVVGLGLFAVYGLVSRQARQLSLADWLDAGLAGLIGAIAGGRLLFVLVNWDYFQLHTTEIWQVWRGGLVYIGVLLGAMSALLIWRRRRQRSFLAYADLYAPALALLSAFGWLACWLEGCAYGREAAVHPLSAPLPDSFGVTLVRYQTQLLGLAATVLIFLLIWRVRYRLYLGQLFWLAMLLLSTTRVVSGLFRGDLGSSLDSYFSPLNSALVADLTVMLVSCGALILGHRRALPNRRVQLRNIEK